MQRSPDCNNCNQHTVVILVRFFFNRLINRVLLIISVGFSLIPWQCTCNKIFRSVLPAFTAGCLKIWIYNTAFAFPGFHSQSLQFPFTSPTKKHAPYSKTMINTTIFTIIKQPFKSPEADSEPDTASSCPVFSSLLISSGLGSPQLRQDITSSSFNVPHLHFQIFIQIPTNILIAACS